MTTPGRWARLWAALGGAAQRGRDDGATAAAAGSAAPRATHPSASAPEPSPNDEIEAIRQVDAGSPTSRARALAALQRAAGTALEQQALAACVTVHGRQRAPSELTCLAAELFTRRGDAETALRLLDGLEEPRGWLLEADLRAERGQHAAALALVERAVAYSIDAPGALERLRRWSPQKAVTPGAGQPTVLAASAPHPHLRIVDEAGRGGAAAVYQAEDSALGRPVALKIYHRPERARDHVLREARMAVKFSDHGVIRVFDVAPDAGWLAMEWAARGSLRQCLGRAPQELPALDAMLHALVATLARIHAAGYVHADIKPGNILFRADFGVLLSDFGLSVPIGVPHLGQSPGYAPRERVLGGVAAATDDVYALGCVLGEVLEAGARCENLAAWQELAALLTSRERPADAAAVLPLLPPLAAGE